MTDHRKDSDTVKLSLLQQSATQRVIEFLTDPEMAKVRIRLQQGWYGPVLGPSCRRAVLEHIGTLGEPGSRMGLLVYSVEILMGLVQWDQVADAVKLTKSEPKRSPYLSQALDSADPT